jgi:hypothetical protein
MKCFRRWALSKVNKCLPAFYLPNLSDGRSDVKLQQWLNIGKFEFIVWSPEKFIFATDFGGQYQTCQDQIEMLPHLLSVIKALSVVSSNQEYIFILILMFGIISAATIPRVSLIVKNFSEASSFPGLTHIYRKEQTVLGAIFWIISSLSLLLIGLYWYEQILEIL